MHGYFGTPIAVYTTADALADGALVDAGPMATELFAWPVLVTQAAWADCVAWTEQDTERTGAAGQSETGRLWDVLWMAFIGIRQELRKARTPGPFTFQLDRVACEATPGREGEVQPTRVSLKAIATLNDDGSPLLLISHPEED